MHVACSNLLHETGSREGIRLMRLSLDRDQHACVAMNGNSVLKFAGVTFLNRVNVAAYVGH